MAVENEFKYLAFRWSATIHIIGYGIFTAVLILFWALGLLEFDPYPILIYVMPIGISINILWFLIGRKSWAKNELFYAFIIMNLMIITAILHYSGGQDSPFLFLYLISIVSTTLISVPATIAVGIASLALFILLLFVGPPVDIQLPIFTRILRLLLLEIIVVAQSSYFISRIKKYQQEISNIKDQFLFKTIHSLRSPAVGLRWTFDKFSHPDFLKRNPDMKDEVNFLQETNQRILLLINDILDIAKGKSLDATLKQHPVSLPALIKNSLLNLQANAAEREILLRYAPTENLPDVRGDAERLQEVFENLIDNAIKYNQKGGSVFISHEREGEILKTIVRDTGEGIPPEEIPNLFSPYFRVRKETPGTGLGLYIARGLIEKMGGTIEVVSVIGSGTSFIVSLSKAGETDNKSPL